MIEYRLKKIHRANKVGYIGETSSEKKNENRPDSFKHLAELATTITQISSTPRSKNGDHHSYGSIEMKKNN